MKKTTKVFLLSNSKRNYDLLKNHGYSDIMWFRTSSSVLDYMKKYPNFLDDIDISFICDIFYKGNNSESIENKVYKRIYEKNMPYVEIGKENFILITSKIVRSNLSERDVFNILSCLKFKEQTALIKQQTKFLVSKENKDIEVLFVGDSRYFSFVESYFQKQGIENITCVQEMVGTNSSLVCKLANYDIVISSNYSVIDCANELSDYLSDKDHFVYLVNYNQKWLVDTNLSDVTLTDTLTCKIKRKSIYTVDDLNKLYQYILDLSLEKYSRLNDKVIVNNIKKFNEIRSEYIAYRELFVRKTDLIRERLYLISELEDLVQRFISRHMKRDMMRMIDDVIFRVLEDGVSVSFIYEDRELARITFFNDSRNSERPYYKEFNLEVLNSEGDLVNLGMRSLYDDRNYKRVDAYPVIDECDFAKIEELYKKVKNMLINKYSQTLKLK